jgi:hypothetical protein
MFTSNAIEILTTSERLVKLIIIDTNLWSVYVSSQFMWRRFFSLTHPSFYIFAFWFFFSFRFRFWLIFIGFSVCGSSVLGFLRGFCAFCPGFGFFWFLFFLFSASYGTLFPFFFIHLTIWYFIYFCRSMIIRILKF